MSLRFKIAGAMALLAGVVAALASLGAYVTASDQLDSTVKESLVSQATAVANRGRQTADGRGSRPTGSAGGAPQCPPPAELQNLTAVQLIVDGAVQPCVEGGVEIDVTAEDVALAESADDGAYRLTRTRAGRRSAWVVTMALPGDGAIQLARSTRESEQVLDGLEGRLIATAVIGTLIAAAAGFGLATRIVAPVRRLTRTAEHIAATRDLSTAVPSAGNDEIGSLSTSFTTMVASLAESQEQQRRLISDASHEMRTPLTSLSTNLELLARIEAGAGSIPPDERRAVIDDLRFETGELTMLLTELVELATDRSATDEPLSEVDLDPLCRGVAERARRRSGREVTVATTGDTVLDGRSGMLERAVSNLVDNALKYSPPDSAVELVVEGRRIEVHDRGSGISDVDLPHVFDRFYRATEARTAPGSGLGLSIVAHVAAVHGGRTFAGNRADGPGAVVGFELDTPTANR